jgi:LPS sulfotransferase NodH
MRGIGIADYPVDPESQLQAIPQLAATPNGIYGLKLHSVEFEKVKGTRWAERLPSLSFIHLERRDVLGQAISFVRASQTQQWVSFLGPKGEPIYNGALIDRVLLDILHQQTRWRYYLARNRVPVLHLTYEDVARFPQETAEAVGRLMGLTEKPCVDLSQVRLKVQRDALNEEWRQRFIAESHDLGRFHELIMRPIPARR